MKRFTRKQKWMIAISAIVALLIITNPSISSFKAFRGADSYSGLYRTQNWFVCSVYKHGDMSYVGVLGNFIEIPKKQITYVEPVDDKKIVSSTPINKKLSVDEFAALIKKKYPEYDGIDNKVLVQKILVKYPIYRNKLKL